MKKPPESRREVKFPDDPPWKLPITTLHLSPPFQPQSAPISKSPNSCGYQKLPSHIKQTEIVIHPKVTVLSMTPSS